MGRDIESFTPRGRVCNRLAFRLAPAAARLTSVGRPDSFARMFTIIGSDGKEYGPVSTDDVRAWIAAGRANLDTKAKAAGTNDWRRLAEFPEFAGPAGSVVPPPIAPRPDANLAGLGARLGAAVIDRVLTAIAIMPGALILGGSFLKVLLEARKGGQPDFSTMDIGRLILGGLLVLVLGLTLLVIQVWMISTRGQSIGKRLVGIKIVRFADGALPGFVNGWLLRNFVNGILCSLPWIGIVYTLVDICFIFGEARRCIHDLIAGTKVVNA